MSKKNRRKVEIAIEKEKEKNSKKIITLEDEKEKIELGKGFFTIPLISAAATTIIFYILVFILVK